MMNLEPYSPRMLSVLRIMTGLLFLAHGTQKLLGFPASANPGAIAMFSLPWFASYIEIFGGLAIILGLFTRPVAFILAGEMAAAYFLAHLPRDFFPVRNGGDAAILFCFIFLFLVTAGPGPWSVDAMRAKTAA